jgi:uncharacterized heparinase superfamily protein
MLDAKNMSILQSAFFYARTIRHLRLIQIFGRIWHQFYSPSLDLRPAPKKYSVPGKWLPPALRANTLISPWHFKIFHKKIELSSWNPEGLPRLWLYHLHYFDDCVSENAQMHNDWIKELVACWIRENTDSRGIGWEPYPLSRRIINWIKWDLANTTAWTDFLHSLAVQARYLVKRCEYYLQGNHLWMNGKALFFAGLYFGGHACQGEAHNWLEKGSKILYRELNEQVRSDGSHYEQSPMYHALFFEDVLDIINLCQTYFWKPEWLSLVRRAASRMAAYLDGVCHPDGQICLFNDAAFNMAPTPADLAAYARRLRIEVIDKAEQGAGWKHWPDAGMVRIDHGPWSVFFDTGPIGPDHIPGHAHADNLTLEISLHGKRLIVDTGTGEYGTSLSRFQQRSTRAHNTVVVDNENSSEVWAGFRVARRAYPIGKTTLKNIEGKVFCKAAHDGYRRLAGKVVYSRAIMVSAKEIVVEDTLSGAGSHEIEINWHLHPDIEPDQKRNTIILKDRTNNILCQISVQGVNELRLESSKYYPEFGLTLQNTKITGSIKTLLPLKIITTFTIL